VSIQTCGEGETKEYSQYTKEQTQNFEWYFVAIHNYVPSLCVHKTEVIKVRKNI
jgi:hypothetical protein